MAGEQMVTVDDGHGISQPKREAAARWFRKWFYNDDQPVHETPAVVLPPASLFSATTGEVNSTFPAEVTVQRHIQQTANTLAGKRQQFLNANTGKAFADTLQRLLGITLQREPVHAEQAGIMQQSAWKVEKLLLRRTNEPPLPVYLLRPAAPVKEVLICLNDEGKKELLDSTALLGSYLQKGYALLLPDLRGMGETADNPEFNHPKFHNKEYRNAISSLHLGKPLLGQRVADLQMLLDFLQSDILFSKCSITVKASGLTALIAMHAAAVDERINRLQVDRYLPSFTGIISDAIGKNWYSYVIPGVLQYYDVPDLLRIVDKRFAIP